MESTGDPPDAEAIRDKAVELGLVAPGSADDALQRYQRDTGRLSFASFLLEDGLIDLDAMLQLQPAEASLETVVNVFETKAWVGREVSGCTIERKLGSGAMGSVFLAQRHEDGAWVVLKFLDPSFALKESSRARFLKTAELVQRLRHPNIAAVYDVRDDAEAPHIVMELIEGEELGARLERDGPLPVEDALNIATQAAEGLAEAHRRGVLHRDIKPDNMLLTPGGELKVIDFGLAKNTLADEGLSHAGQVLGTPYFMAPEQWGEHEVDARCDIFSLGATLFRLLTGELPFKGEKPMDVARNIVQGRFPPPRVLRPDLPEDLELVLIRMLEPDRSRRYSSMEELLEDMERLRAGEPPDIPRLEALGKLAPFRMPLLRREVFEVGRQTGNHLKLGHPTISRKHAELRREPSGFLLRDLGSSHGTFVGGHRIKEVLLKDRDKIRFGNLTFRFHAGPGGSKESSTGEPQAARRVSDVFLEALVGESDKRTVVALIEALARGTHEGRIELVRRQLDPTFGSELAAAVANRFRADLKSFARRAAAVLFVITKENLGGDPGRWLSWWSTAWSGYPKQLGPETPPHLPRPSLRLSLGDETTPIPLSGESVFSIGRDEGSAIRIDDMSVSRLHGTLLRLDQRLAVRDEGSRFGVLLNGSRVPIEFLCEGDRLVLGKAELTFHAEWPQLPATQPLWIEPRAFAALTEEHPAAAALGLARLHDPSRVEWVRATAAKLAQGNDLLRLRLEAAVVRRHQDWARKARELLPDLLGTDVPGEWEGACTVRRSTLPAQVLPLGWGLTQQRSPQTRIRLRKPTG